MVPGLGSTGTRLTKQFYYSEHALSRHRRFVVAMHQVPGLENGDWHAWYRSRRVHRMSAPVPYGIAFSATLCPFTKAPRKSLPTGHRPAAPAGICSLRGNERTSPQFYVAPDTEVATGSG